MQQQKLFKIMDSILIAWSLEKKLSEEMCASQPGSEKLEEDAETAEPEIPSQPPEPLLSQHSPAAQPLQLSPPEEFGEDE